MFLQLMVEVLLRFPEPKRAPRKEKWKKYSQPSPKKKGEEPGCSYQSARPALSKPVLRFFVESLTCSQRVSPLLVQHLKTSCQFRALTSSSLHASLLPLQAPTLPRRSSPRPLVRLWHPGAVCCASCPTAHLQWLNWPNAVVAATEPDASGKTPRAPTLDRDHEHGQT